MTVLTGTTPLFVYSSSHCRFIHYGCRQTCWRWLVGFCLFSQCWWFHTTTLTVSPTQPYLHLCGSWQPSSLSGLTNLMGLMGNKRDAQIQGNIPSTFINIIISFATTNQKNSQFNQPHIDLVQHFHQFDHVLPQMSTSQIGQLQRMWKWGGYWNEKNLWQILFLYLGYAV